MNSIHRLSRFRNHTRRIFTVLLFLICLTACCANAASELRLFFPGEPDSYLVVDAQNHWGIQDAQGNWHRTSGQKAQPFLKPAATEHADKYRAIMKDALKNG